jgi:hypothetical protein
MTLDGAPCIGHHDHNLIAVCIPEQLRDLSRKPLQVATILIADHALLEAFDARFRWLARSKARIVLFKEEFGHGDVVR